MALNVVTGQNVNKITFLIDFALYVTFYSQYLNPFLLVVHFWFKIFTIQERQAGELPAIRWQSYQKKDRKAALTPTGVQK